MGPGTTITPGPGSDLVRSGGDIDRVIADPTQDGDDVLELGSGTLNGVDYSARTEPLHLAGGILNAGVEEDRLVGFNEVIGGSGDDEFHSNGEFLKGGPGDDTLIGSPGNDEIFGGIGNDLIHGEAGDDSIYGGEGDDEIEGGPGGDRLYGEDGNDMLEGGPGDDEVVGEAGADDMRGGEGEDLLLAGRAQEWPGGYRRGVPVDTGVDALDCGPGTDTSLANQWDNPANCETRQIIRAVRVEGIERNRRKGLAMISYNVAGSGLLRIGGNGVKEISRQIKLRPGEEGLPGWSATERPGKVAVRAAGKTKARLDRRGQVVLTLRITWHPARQTAVTETRRMKLVRRSAGAGRPRGARPRSGRPGRSGATRFRAGR